MGLSKLVIGVIGALVTGLLLHIVLPAFLGVVLAVGVSGLTILDPLYAGERIKSTWFTLGTVLMLHVLHTFVTAIIAGGLVGYLASRLQSLWLYPIGALLSIILHYLLFFVFAVGLSVIAAERNSDQVWGISLIIITVVGPIIGLISAFVVRQWGT
jgi:hypothetical protein